jgi:T5SS/PEP-CTERM-associated repeat protein
MHWSMRQPARLRFVVLHLLTCLNVLLSAPLEAQTLYVTNTTNISTSQSYSNGFIGASNTLISVPAGTLGINSGATVTVSNTLTMGTGTNTTSNSITVSGSGSELNVAYLILGFQSSGNSLLITNGATLRTDLTNASTETVNVGVFAQASNNTITVSGAGSGWIQTNTNRAVTIGNSGDNNQLIFNGGSVSSIGGVINVGGPNASANNNSMLVTGAGTVLTNRSIFLGGGDAQSLVISDGAQVVSTSTGSATINPSFSLAATLGALSPGQQHTALITDPGTVYTMRGGANIGLNGAASMVVSNGASVRAGDCWLGSNRERFLPARHRGRNDLDQQYQPVAHRHRSQYKQFHGRQCRGGRIWRQRRGNWCQQQLHCRLSDHRRRNLQPYKPTSHARRLQRKSEPLGGHEWWRFESGQQHPYGRSGNF